MQAQIDEFNNEKDASNNGSVDKPIQNVPREILEEKERHKIQKLTISGPKESEFYSSTITYYINTERKTQEKEEQIQVKCICKCSTAWIVIPSSTER